MEEFKKDLLKTCGKSTVALVIVFTVTGFFLVMSLLMLIVESEGAPVFYILTALFAFLGILILVLDIRKKNAVKNKIAMLEQNGGLQRIFSDFAGGPHIFSSRMRLAVSSHFILDYNDTKEGFYVYPLHDITNIFKCNMVNGDPTTTNYIALETADGRRSLVMARNGNSKELNNILSLLQQNINQGGVMTW